MTNPTHARDENDGTHSRRSIRLDGYDYTQAGAYFITIATAARVEVFGTVSHGEMILNAIGEMACGEWRRLPGRFQGLELGVYQVMPDHFHGILLLSGPGEPTPPTGAQRNESGQKRFTEPLRPYDETNPRRSFEDNVAPGSVGAIVRAYKAAVALRYNRMRLPEHGPLWQRNYYEHIIRSSGQMERISRYILDNPFQWDIDHP
jgi:putative transposase